MNYGRLFKAESFDHHNLHRPVLGGGHDPVPVPQQAGGSRPRMSNRLFMNPVLLLLCMYCICTNNTYLTKILSFITLLLL